MSCFNSYVKSIELKKGEPAMDSPFFYCMNFILIPLYSVAVSRTLVVFKRVCQRGCVASEREVVARVRGSVAILISLATISTKSYRT